MYVVEYPTARIPLTGSFVPLHFVPNKTFMARAAVKVERGQNLRCLDSKPTEPFPQFDQEQAERLIVRLCEANEVQNCVALQNADSGDWLRCVMIEPAGGIRLPVDEQGRAELPAEVVNAAPDKSYESVQSEAEFFRKSIMAE